MLAGVLCYAMSGAPLPAQDALPGIADAAGVAEVEDDDSPRLKFKDAPLDFVLDEYSQKTGKTMLLAPGLPNVKINLTSASVLTLEEYLQAIETVLSMHGIALLESGEGDKFLKVVSIKSARQESMPILEGLGDDRHAETDRLVSQMIPLKFIEIEEAKKAIEALKHAFASLHLFERTRSILVTDTAANINRMRQIVEYIDVEDQQLEEPNVVQVRYAKAADIKKKLEEIIADAQKEAEKRQSTVPRQKDAGAPGAEATPTVAPGLAGLRPAKRSATPEVLASIIEQAERGVIRGKVKIIADERTNLLIIITWSGNMPFFEKIIRVLDVETDPDVVIKIRRLEYADAENVASTLNTLIGKDDRGPEVKPPAADGEAGGEGGERSAALREYVDRLEQARAREKEKSAVGELSSSNIKILPDKRTNSLIIMASRADHAALDEIIKNMDMMLSQVMIEAVIIQVDLDDSVSSGVHWVQRAILSYEQNASGERTAKGAYAGGFGGGRSDTLDVTGLSTLGS